MQFYNICRKFANLYFLRNLQTIFNNIEEWSFLLNEQLYIIKYNIPIHLYITIMQFNQKNKFTSYNTFLLLCI